MFLCRKASGGRFTDLFREVDKLGELVNGCIAGDAWQRRIALGRAHGPGQRTGYHRPFGVVSKCALRE